MVDLSMDFYHALNRGVDKRTIFLDKQDYLRFVHDMYEFNDTTPATNVRYHSKSREPKGVDSGHKRGLVNIHGWCLMKNHYHLLLSEKIDGGITLFLRKLNIGYAKYFNQKYERSGTLFQGRTKKILIENDQQFNYILHYIHLNPLDYLKGNRDWRIRDKNTVANYQSCLTYLGKYRWSSYLDYCGEKNFPSIVTKDFFGDAFGEYRTTLSSYLKTSASTETQLRLEG